ncbi:hypothetical protein AMTRI_Chr03g147060 [Amborella trichopoda]
MENLCIMLHLLLIGSYDKGIFCSWDDDVCVHLLQNCHKALPETRKVIALEQILRMHTDTIPSTRALHVFLMEIYSPGSKRRTKDIFRRLREAAGFRTLELVLPGSSYTVGVSHLATPDSYTVMVFHK